MRVMFMGCFDSKVFLGHSAHLFEFSMFKLDVKASGPIVETFCSQSTDTQSHKMKAINFLQQTKRRLKGRTEYFDETCLSKM